MPTLRNAWRGMMQRCYDPKNISYRNYGGQGVGVCHRWHHYPNFVADKGPRHPGPGLTLHRLRNDRNYSQSNTVWATRTVQGRYSKRVVLTLPLAKRIRKDSANGSTQRELAARYKVSKGTIYYVLHNMTWRP